MASSSSRTSRTTEVQTLIFPKEHFPSAEAARRWAISHGFRANEIAETKVSFRIRQADPAKFSKATFRTISLERLGLNVKAVVGKRRC